jgi:hypothetical protein
VTDAKLYGPDPEGSLAYVTPVLVGPTVSEAP